MLGWVWDFFHNLQSCRVLHWDEGLEQLTEPAGNGMEVIRRSFSRNRVHLQGCTRSPRKDDCINLTELSGTDIVRVNIYPGYPKIVPYRRPVWNIARDFRWNYKSPQRWIG